jgi:hypothetical protein
MLNNIINNNYDFYEPIKLDVKNQTNYNLERRELHFEYTSKI